MTLDGCGKPQAISDGLTLLTTWRCDASNVVLSAVGHNLRLVLAWLRMLLRLILNVLSPLLTARTPLKWAS